MERTGLAAELARLGADVVEGTPAELPPRLADRYLALKARRPALISRSPAARRPRAPPATSPVSPAADARRPNTAT